MICFVIYFEPYCVQISPFQPSFTDISVVVVTQPISAYPQPTSAYQRNYYYTEDRLIWAEYWLMWAAYRLIWNENRLMWAEDRLMKDENRLMWAEDRLLCMFCDLSVCELQTHTNQHRVSDFQPYYVTLISFFQLK